MENFLEKVLAMIIIVVMLFIIPLRYSFENQDDITYNVVYNEVNLFIQEVSDLGYISSNRYELLADKIGATGLVYDIDIEHKKKFYVPDPVNPLGYLAVYEGFYNRQILSDTIYDPVNPGDYTMGAGDFITVEVVNRGLTKAEVMKNMFYSGGIEGSIFVRIGGKVTNEGL